ncbi:MAG: MCP four helix bundle domain-containing protein, partial [Burkholderiaceae bacterium]|nr:MCP four helix bundle domain-containing protein [Burkholderiaceae bacterium]
MLSNMKIGLRMGAGFTSVLLLMMALALIGLNGMAEIEERLDGIVRQDVYQTKLINEMSEAVHVISRVTRTIALLKDPVAIGVEEKKIDQARRKYNEAWEALEKAPTADKEKAIRARIKELLLAARPLNDKVRALSDAGKKDDAVKALLDEAAPATQKIQDALDEDLALQAESTAHDYAVAKQEYAHARQMMLMLAGGAILLGGAIAWFLTRGITQPLARVVEAANRLAGGDLTVRIEARTKDETGQVLLAMQNMIEKLSQVVTDVNSGAQALASASEEVSATSQSLSQASSEQAASVEETSASIEQMTASIAQNTENAKVTDAMASKAAKEAAQGGESVNATVAAMKQIAKKIGIIDDIAYQTNLLALNAAIE